jgi:hypothetical protein
VLRDWSLRRRPDTGHYTARVVGDELGIDLQAVPQQAWLLQGDQGFSRKGPDASQASFYVSQPHLAVQGTLALKGQRFEVRGTAWLDHEWSEALLHPEAVGWDWIGMNLFDGHSLTAFQLRRKDGSKLWAGGSFRAAGSAQSATDIYRFSAGEVDFQPRRWWTSPLPGGVGGAHAGRFLHGEGRHRPAGTRQPFEHRHGVLGGAVRPDRQQRQGRGAGLPGDDGLRAAAGAVSAVRQRSVNASCAPRPAKAAEKPRRSQSCTRGESMTARRKACASRP